MADQGEARSSLKTLDNVVRLTRYHCFGLLSFESPRQPACRRLLEDHRKDGRSGR